MADDLDPAAVERAARAILTLGCIDQDGLSPEQQVEREWADPEQRDLSFAAARAALTAARAGEPAAPGQPTAAEVVAIIGAAIDPDCPDRPVDRENWGDAWRVYDALAAAGLLRTPEHDAQVGARASWSSWHQGWAAGWKDHERRTNDLDAYAQEGSTPNPYRIERPEEGR